MTFISDDDDQISKNRKLILKMWCAFHTARNELRICEISFNQKFLFRKRELLNLRTTNFIWECRKSIISSNNCHSEKMNFKIDPTFSNSIQETLDRFLRITVRFKDPEIGCNTVLDMFSARAARTLRAKYTFSNARFAV